MADGRDQSAKHCRKEIYFAVDLTARPYLAAVINKFTRTCFRLRFAIYRCTCIYVHMSRVCRARRY